MKPPTYDELVAERDRLAAELAEALALFNAQNVTLAAVEASERNFLEKFKAEREAHARTRAKLSNIKRKLGAK